MNALHTGPFRADHVGSLLRPKRLFEARAARRRGTLPPGELRAIENECVVRAAAKQEEIGLKGITDGDFRRDDWFLDFMFSLDGLEQSGEFSTVPFSGGLAFHPPIARMTGRVGCPPGGIMVEDFSFLRSVTNETAKVCIPAPAMFFVVITSEQIDRRVYPEPQEFWHDLGNAYSDAVGAFAAAGCRYLQIDDVNSGNLGDENWQQFWRSQGQDPSALLDAFIDLNNAAVASRPPGMAAAIHMCKGNYQSEWCGAGSYDMVAERYFARSDVDAFFLEFDDERSGGFEPLRHVPKDKQVVLGLMTSKRAALEDKDELKRRIDEAAKYVPLERLCISPQCGFASTQEGNRLTEDEQWRKLEHLVEVAVEVWGSV